MPQALGKAAPLGPPPPLTLGMAQGEKQSQANKAGAMGLGLGEMRKVTRPPPSPAFCSPVLIGDLFLSSFQEKGHMMLFMKATLDYFTLLFSHSLTMSLYP